MADKKEFSKYERARILGARGLQVSMDAPLLIKISKEELEKINYDPLKIAEKELELGVLPISIKRPMPKREEFELKKIKVEEKDVPDEVKIKTEEETEKEIAESGEIMEIANPDDEGEEESTISEEVNNEEDLE